MKRTPETQKAYDKYLELIKEKKIKPFSENEVVKLIKNEGGYVMARLVKNKFPYLGYTKDTHLILVINKKYNNYYRFNLDVLKSKNPDWEVIENKKKDQSVPNIRHIHFLKKLI
jgi:hypothetical protein